MSQIRLQRATRVSQPTSGLWRCHSPRLFATFVIKGQLWVKGRDALNGCAQPVHRQLRNTVPVPKASRSCQSVKSLRDSRQRRGLSADVAARLEIVDRARAICLGVRGVANLIPPTQIRLADFSLVRAMSPSTV
jgi:hypothetical protein